MEKDCHGPITEGISSYQKWLQANCQHDWQLRATRSPKGAITWLECRLCGLLDTTTIRTNLKEGANMNKEYANNDKATNDTTKENTTALTPEDKFLLQATCKHEHIIKVVGASGAIYDSCADCGKLLV